MMRTGVGGVVDLVQGVACFSRGGRSQEVSLWNKFKLFSNAGGVLSQSLFKICLQSSDGAIAQVNFGAQMIWNFSYKQLL